MFRHDQKAGTYENRRNERKADGTEANIFEFRLFRLQARVSLITFLLCVSFPNTTRTKREKKSKMTVRFEEEDLLTTVYLIPNRLDFSREELETLFVTKSEKKENRKELKSTLTKLKLRPVSSCDEDLIGLESHLYPSEKMRLRKRATSFVLSFKGSSENLAASYQIITLQSKRSARERGLKLCQEQFLGPYGEIMPYCVQPFRQVVMVR